MILFSVFQQAQALGMAEVAQQTTTMPTRNTNTPSIPDTASPATSATDDPMIIGEDATRNDERKNLPSFSSSMYGSNCGANFDASDVLRDRSNILY